MSITNLLLRYGKLKAVTRPGPGMRIKGQWQDNPAGNTQFPATISMQPFGLREMMLIAEGERPRRWMWVYSDTALQGVVPPRQKGDRLTYQDGTVFEIQNAADFAEAAARLSLNHFKYKAAAIEQD